MAKKNELTPNTSQNVPEGLKLLYLEIENFKNITKKVINIDGRSMLIIGKNQSGKSSTMQAMTSPLDTRNLPTEPVKKGEERARILQRIGGVIHGEYQEYTLDMHFTPKNNKGTLTLYNKNNEKVNAPATTIKNIIGNVSFDIMDWLHAKKDKRLEILKNLTGKGKDIDLLNMDIKAKKADRKYKKDRAEELEGAIKNHEFPQEEIEMYMEPRSMDEVSAEMAAIQQRQAQWDEVKLKYDGFVRDQGQNIDKMKNSFKEKARLLLEIDRLKELVVVEEENLSRYEQERVKLEGNIAKGAEWLNRTPRPTTEALNQKIADITAHNEKHNRIGMLGSQQREMIALKQEVAQINIDIEKLEQKRNHIIETSQLPVPGLTFSDEDIFLNDLPLEEGQVNTATLRRIGVKIAMAMNPNYKVIFLNDASLMDQDAIRATIEEIEEHGFMAVAEIVGMSEEPEIVFTEQIV